VPCEGALRLLGRRKRLARVREGDKEAVALGVDLNTAVPRKGCAQQSAVLGQDLCVAVSEGVQESGRALNVCEEKGDPARRKIWHASSP